MQPLRTCSARFLLRSTGTLSRTVSQTQKCSLSRQLAGAGHLNCNKRQQGARAYTSRASMSTASSFSPKPQFSVGSDETALGQKLQTLLTSAHFSGDQVTAGGKWTLISSGKGLERSFKFKTFAKTWDFMTAVALQCKLKNHHPEWSNVYNTTFIRWTTHNPDGLSAQDIELASICDGLARDFAEIVEDNSAANSCSLGKQLADTVASNAGDCCTPKPKPK